jgi:hypothetical protein
MSNFLYVKHLLAVLLGFKPSIASTLRHILLPPTPSRWAFWRSAPQLPTIESLRKTIPTLVTTSCYLIFNTGKETMTIEKDRITGLVRTSDTFITATNHDADTGVRSNLPAPTSPAAVTGMDEIVDESLTRKACAQKCFDDAVKAAASAANPTSSGKTDDSAAVAAPTGVTVQDVEKWLGTYPILNECTHHASIMDPTTGQIRWARRWVKPFRPGKEIRSLYASPWHS